jgi:hypothetical protein
LFVRDSLSRIGILLAMRWVALVVVACPAIGIADDLSTTKHEKPREALPDHTLYVEALGKAGPYGIGYEHGITPRLALGVAASYAVIDDQQLTTVAPYVHADLIRGKRHSMYGDFGLIVVHSRIPSPVPEWDGMSDTGAGGQCTLGWEWRPWRLVTRTSLGVAVGEGGVAPFLGFAVGARL